MGLDFLLISGEQLASGGGLDGVIRELGKLADNAIRMAVTHRGILVFFDEFDAVAPRRMDSKYRSAVLGTVGRLRGTPKLVLAAATNFYQRLDAATIRAGRFDCHVELPFPDAATLARLIRAFLQHEWLAPRIEDAALAALAGRWAEQRVSVSECRAAVHGAIRAAVRDRGPRPYVLELADLRLPARQTPPQSEEAIGMADWG
ncbi:MAG: ATP-binding protein [Candidatus Competibacteraceae bacterium]|nr:MAG: ATP-binding protein [Candidatus Competibacteraceae bacterium]